MTMRFKIKEHSMWFPFLSLMGCTSTGDELSFLMYRAAHTPFVDERVRGFDLDGRIGTMQDAQSCFLADAVDPQGTPGIDNGLSALLEELSGTELEMFSQYLQETIDLGAFLVMVHLRGVDDLQEDSHVDVALVLTEGEPLVGANGIFLDGQTLYPTEPKSITSSQGYIQDGILYAQGLDLSMILSPEDWYIEIPFHEVSLKAQLQEDGTMKGYFGGSTSAENFLFFTQVANTGFFDYLAYRIIQHADMAPDAQGVCQEISSAFDFEAVPAHLAPK